MPMPMPIQLAGITITVNYPDDECEAAVPTEMTVDQLCEMIQKLCVTEPEMTSFVVLAAVRRA